MNIKNQEKHENLEKNIKSFSIFNRYITKNSIIHFIFVLYVIVFVEYITSYEKIFTKIDCNFFNKLSKDIFQKNEISNNSYIFLCKILKDNFYDKKDVFSIIEDNKNHEFDIKNNNNSLKKEKNEICINETLIILANILSLLIFIELIFKSFVSIICMIISSIYNKSRKWCAFVI